MTGSAEKPDFTSYTSFLSKLDGVESAVITSEEGFPLDFTGLEQDKAEAAAALAVDLVLSATATLRDLSPQSAREIIIETEDGRVIDVTKVRNLLILVRGSRRPVEEAVAAVHAHESGGVHCPHCGADLSLETIKCPKCGRVIPFTSFACPHCQANVNIKKCPKCGKLTTSRGELVVEAKSPDALAFAAIESVLAGIIVGGLVAMAVNSLALGIASGILGAGGVGTLLYMKLPTVKRIVKPGRSKGYGSPKKTQGS